MIVLLFITFCYETITEMSDDVKYINSCLLCDGTLIIKNIPEFKNNKTVNLEFLCKNKEIVEVRLNDTGINDNDCDKIVAIPNLQDYHLANDKLTSIGLKKILKTKKAIGIDLSNNNDFFSRNRNDLNNIVHDDTLLYLQIQTCGLSKHHLECIVRNRNLTFLGIGTHYMLNYDLNPLLNNRNLTELSLLAFDIDIFTAKLLAKSRLIKLCLLLTSIDPQCLDIVFSSNSISTLTITNYFGKEQSCSYDDTKFMNIINNKELTTLTLESTTLSLNYMQNILLNTTLHMLDIDCAEINGKMFKNIKNTNIVTLRLFGKFDDTGCMYLSASEKLVDVYLNVKNITDNGVAFIAKSKSIMYLTVLSGNIGDLSCKYLKHNMALKTLRLGVDDVDDENLRSKITNGGIHHLLENTNIRELILTKILINSECEKYFLKNNTLTEVCLNKTRMTKESCERIKEHISKNRQRVGEYDSYEFARSSESILWDVDRYIIDKYIN
jgi:hypothetical protein